MAKRILVVAASPRKDGNSDLLCERFIEGALEAGNIVEEVFLREQVIGFCRACDYCRDRDGACALRDDAASVLDKMAEADVHICIDPRLSGSGKEADYWLNLKPGTDGALALCWQHIIIEHDLVDWEFVKRWTDASLLVVEDMEPTGGRYIDLSSPVQVPPLEDLIGTKLKTRLLKESDLKEGGSPHKFYAWNKNANDGAGGLVYWDADATQWEGCNHVAPTRDQMEVVYKGTSQEGYLPPLSYWELEEAGIDFDLKGTHEIELADGTKHVAKPVWAYLEEVFSLLYY